MREMSVRWGLGMGAAGTALGVLALLIGQMFEPSTRFADATAVATAYFVRGILVLLSLGIALALAYYGGWRAALALAESRDGAAPQNIEASANRLDAVFAGGIALFAYWFITSLYLWVLLAPQDRQPILSFLASRLVFGVLCVVLGAGMGGMGARAALARLVLRRVSLGQPASVPAAPVLTSPAATAPIEPPASSGVASTIAETHAVSSDAGDE